MFEHKYEDLAAAIVMQAVKDYKRALKYREYRSIAALERFFRSEWCFTLCHLNGDAIIDELRERYGKNDEF